MNILLINGHLAPLPGLTIRKLSTHGGGIFSLRKLLQSRGYEEFRPDLLVQQECLGSRVFFRDLADFSCPRVFWAVDSHLNMHWQRWYGQIFDLVLTPHPSLFRALPGDWQLPNVHGLPMPGHKRAWIPHAQRTHQASFVGVLDTHRLQRLRFVAFLQKYHGVEARRLSFPDMLALYDATRLLPNESICGEFNFRITEGASCGACVLTEDIGDDLTSNFLPGRELLTYRHALELHELMTYLTAHPTVAEHIARAGWERVQKEHLPEHRCQRLLALAKDLAAHAWPREDVQRIVTIAAIQAARADKAEANVQASLCRALAQYTPTVESSALELCLTLEAGETASVRAKILEHLAQGPLPFDLGAVCLGAALTLKDIALIAKAHDLLPNLPSLPPEQSPFQVAMALAQLFAQRARYCRPGFLFDPHKQIPETALEALLVAEQFATSDAETRALNLAKRDLAEHIPLLDLRLTAAAKVSLEHQDNWRDSFAYALQCLVCFRFSDGLKEFAVAHALAEQHGETRAFFALLKEHGIPTTVYPKSSSVII